MRSVLFRTAKKSGSRLISINNQVRGMEESAARSKDARKYADRNFPTRAIITEFKETTWHKNSLSSKPESYRGSNDDVASNRAELSDLRKQLSVSGGGDYERFRWEANRLPRASSGNSAARLPHPHVRRVRILGG